MSDLGRTRRPCILVRLNRACDEFVVTGTLRFVTSSFGEFKTGRNAPETERDRQHDWRTRKSFLAPELSDDAEDAFVFAHPEDAGNFVFHFAGGTRLMDWATRSPGNFQRGEFVPDEMRPAFLEYWRMLGASGDEPTVEQVWAAYRVLIRSGMAEGMPDADWIRQRLGVGS